MSISELINVYTMKYDLEDVKVSFNLDIKINANEIQIEGKHGDILNVPRWIAEILYREKIVDIQDDDMVKVLGQSIIKENNQGQFDVSTLDSDFYIKMNAFLQKLPQDDRDKVESNLISLIRTRQGKIIRLADSSKLTSELSKKLTIEERAFFDSIRNLSSEFRTKVIGKKI